MAISLKNIWGRFKRMLSTNLLMNISEISGSKNIMSDDMMNAITLWQNLYEDKTPIGENGEMPVLGLPSIIASEIARSVTVEMDVSITGSDLADYITEQLKNVMRDIKSDVEYACATGGIVYKPCVSGEKISIETIKADMFYPMEFDNDGNITKACFLYRHWKGKSIYSRLETHTVGEETYIVTNKAFVSSVEESLGRECNLNEVEAWAEIEPTVEIKGITTPLFAYFKMPIVNMISPESPLGVSIFARGVRLIKEAERQFNRLVWEYEGGELAIDASVDAFKTVNGNPMLPEGKERLYRTNNIDSVTDSSSLMKAWTPSLRDSNYINGFNRILMQIENVCYLSRGVLSDPSESAKTATEIKIMKQRSYELVKHIQDSLELAINTIVESMRELVLLYDIRTDGELNVSCTFDDSIITDTDSERVRDQQEVSQGLMLPYEYRMKWYGEDEETAKEKLLQSQQEQISEDDIFGFGEPDIEGDTQTSTEL